MKTLDRSDIPEDFTYYRSGSRVFYEYYKKYTKMIVFRIGKWYEFIKAWRIIGNIYRVNVEKIDQEPTVEMVRKQGIKHGVIWWWPMHKKEKPKGWFRLPTFLAKENFHSSRSAFSILDREDYWNKWVPSARAHRRKVHGLIEKWVLRIEQTLDMNVYLEAYKKTKVPDPFKSWLIRWSEGVRDLKLEENTRIYVAYIDNKLLAAAIFIDEGVTSEYFTSFYAKESHPYHLGIALMDRWFGDSYKKWIKYCDLDHMHESGQSTLGNTKGYTKFKESIVDHDVYFHDMWIKFF